jgi:carbamoyltransferase
VTTVLGISAFFHDSAACIVRDGEIVAAVQEERLSRIKNDASFPRAAVQACLALAGATIRDVDLAVFYELPFLRAERVLHSQIRFAPRGVRAFPRAIRALFGEKLWVEHAIAEQLQYEGPVLFVPHHLSHAASAYLPSPFDDAAILTIDGVGEWSSSTTGRGSAAVIETLDEQRFPHSLGLFYAAMTVRAGFRVNSGESKLMGLAPYGRPRFVEVLEREVIRVGDDGSVRLNLRHFDFPAGTTLGRRSLDALLGGPPSPEGAPPGEREADLAASAQDITERAMVRMSRHARARTQAPNLCLAGGVALNCVGVARILEDGAFREVFVQPAAGDAGGALGAALLGAQHLTPLARPTRSGGRDAMRSALLGPRYGDADVEGALAATGMHGRALSDAEIDEAVAALLAEGSIVGWFQGPVEFGPRALGARSILADPRGDGVRDRVNREMKRREAFRPFAPAALAEEAGRYFDVTDAAPYMIRTVRVRSFEGASRGPSDALSDGWRVRSAMPAITHVDGSARLQTVSRDEHPRFHALLRAFFRRAPRAPEHLVQPPR